MDKLTRMNRRGHMTGVEAEARRAADIVRRGFCSCNRAPTWIDGESCVYCTLGIEDDMVGLRSEVVDGEWLYVQFGPAWIAAVQRRLLVLRALGKRGKTHVAYNPVHSPFGPYYLRSLCQRLDAVKNSYSRLIHSSRPISGTSTDGEVIVEVKWKDPDTGEINRTDRVHQHLDHPSAVTCKSCVNILSGMGADRRDDNEQSWRTRPMTEDGRTYVPSSDPARRWVEWAGVGVLEAERYRKIQDDSYRRHVYGAIRCENGGAL